MPIEPGTAPPISETFTDHNKVILGAAVKELFLENPDSAIPAPANTTHTLTSATLLAQAAVKEETTAALDALGQKVNELMNKLKTLGILS